MEKRQNTVSETSTHPTLQDKYLQTRRSLCCTLGHSQSPSYRYICSVYLHFLLFRYRIDNQWHRMEPK